MSVTVAETSSYAQLRQEAEARLRAGTATASQWSLGVDALQMLHRLSSDPGTAADALKLLHELQVHQVELDLQSEQMRWNEALLAEELSCYRELYELAPVGYFRVDLQGAIMEVNQVGAAQCSMHADELIGRPMTSLLTSETGSALLELMQGLGGGGDVQSCRVELRRDASAMRSQCLLARLSGDGRSVLLACCECRQCEA
jgi:PAS domain S-box-containing protein